MILKQIFQHNILVYSCTVHEKDYLLGNCKMFTVIVFKLSQALHSISYHVECFSNHHTTMVKTNRIKVLSDSEMPESIQTRSNKDSTDDQLEVVRRLFKLLTAFCIGHLILSVVTATSLGVYVSEHVRIIL